MLNQLVIVGRLVKDPEIKETESGKKVSNITLAVQRSYKNENGEYDTDFIDCTLWNNVANTTADYCRKGDLLGVKGRVCSSIDENNIKSMNLVAERVTFLSSRSNEKESITCER